MTQQESTMLPPGQRESDAFPRFGLTPFATRFPSNTTDKHIEIHGEVEESIRIDLAQLTLTRVSQQSDFHCVTTWTKRNLLWGGIRFKDFYENCVLPGARPHLDAKFIVFRCQDGFRAGMQLSDLLQDNVLIADTLDGEALSIAHGAPMRLIAPSHYGYKSPKHINRIEFCREEKRYRPPAFRFMDHPRARVQYEERGTFFPGWLLRWLYRPLIPTTIRKFHRALVQHEAATKEVKSTS